MSFLPTISSGKLSPSVILNSISDSSDIPTRFVAATETRNRVETSVMMKTVSLLNDTIEAHRQMWNEVSREYVDAGTSWTTALSKLLTSLADMMRGHIAVSMSLLSILDDVYLNRVSYLVIGLSNQLEECHSLIAEVQVIITRAQLRTLSDEEIGRIQLLLGRYRYLNTTLDDFDSMLAAESDEMLNTSHNTHYFPGHLLIGNCDRLFRNVSDSLQWQISVLSSLNTTDINAGETEVNEILFNMTDFRSDVANLKQCLLSYKEELYSFEDELSTITFTASFSYEPPTTSLRMFNMDGQWLDSITSQYIANSLSKLYLATAFHANGSKLLTNADQLYSDIELSLFSKVSDHIDNQEKNMVSFYRDLLARVASLQRYMFTDDASLELFMRRLSIWRMPIVNFQKSQVLFIFSSYQGLFSVQLCTICAVGSVICADVKQTVQLVYCINHIARRDLSGVIKMQD